MNLKDKKVIAFDLDDTISLSKQDVDNSMAEELCKLLEKKYVAIISGADFDQFKKQVIRHLKCTDLFNRLYILPTKGAELYKYEDKEWKKKYSYTIPKDERERIKCAIYDALNKYGFEYEGQVYGERMMDRGSQITFSALGGDAPLSVKQEWDPGHKKREEIVKILKPLLPDYQIGIGGKTSIDITPLGIDKAFGLKKLSENIHIPLDWFLFIGDALFEGGNDESVKRLDISTIAVDGNDQSVKDTILVIENILKNS